MYDFGMTDFWKNSLAFQKDVAENWMKTLQGAAPAAAGETPKDDEANPFVRMMQGYRDMYDQWQKQLIDNPWMKGITANDFGMTDFWEKSLAFQKDMAENWMKTLQGAAPAAVGEANPFIRMMQGYRNMYDQWQKQFIDNPWMKMTPWPYNTFTADNAWFDMLNKIFNSGSSYTDLLDFWQKLAGRDPFETRDDILKFLEENKAAYEKVAQDLMLPFIPESLRPVMNNYRELLKRYEAAGKKFVAPWLEADKKSAAAIRRMMQGDKDAYLDLYKIMDEAYGRTYGKMFKAAGLGLTKEQNEALMDQYDAYCRMMISFNELVHIHANIVRENMVRLIEAYQDLVRKGAEPKNVRAFYDLWLQINEDSYIRIFKTPQFSEILAEFNKRACEFKSYSDRVMEQWLAWLPVPKNSDMDGLYKTVYQLRKAEFRNTKKIRELEDEVAALKGSAAAPAATGKPSK